MNPLHHNGFRFRNQNYTVQSMCRVGGLRNARPRGMFRWSGSSRSPGRRSRSRLTAIVVSVLASCAPRQKCGPCANARLTLALARRMLNPVGVGEHGRIPVGAADRYGDSVTALDPRAPELEIAGGVAVDDRGRRLQPYRLLDRVRQEIRAATDKCERLRVAEQVPDRVNDHALG